MTKMKKKANVKIILLCVFAGFLYVLPFLSMFFIAIFFDGEKTFEIKDNVVEISNGKMMVENVDGFYDEEEKMYYIVGYLKNKTDKTYTDIGLQYRVYDEENNVLGSADSVYLEYLAKGENWRFKIMYSDIDASDVHHFELHRVEYN